MFFSFADTTAAEAKSLKPILRSWPETAFMSKAPD
jgi:hypothetical protein